MDEMPVMDRLHDMGVVLAMIIAAQQFVGVKKNEDGTGYCLVRGPISDIEKFDRLCFTTNYDAAIDAFGEWWDAGFDDAPPCSNGVRLV